MSSDQSQKPENEALDLAISLAIYPYHYNVVKKFSGISALEQENLAKSNGQVAQTLAALFSKHGIKQVSLTPLEKAVQIADRWLQDGSVDEAAVQEVLEEASQQLQILSPVLKEIFESGKADGNFFGGPLVLAAIGNAMQLAENTLRFSHNEEINSPELRAEILNSISKKDSTPEEPTASPN
jgi:hypothetical protein